MEMVVFTFFFFLERPEASCRVWVSVLLLAVHTGCKSQC